MRKSDWRVVAVAVGGLGQSPFETAMPQRSEKGYAAGA